MTLFPDSTSNVAGADKVTDPDGYDYADATDKAGYILYQHDVTGSGPPANPNNGTDVNYVATQYTSYWYTVDEAGTVTQYDTET
jgi:hypothetical protein